MRKFLVLLEEQQYNRLIRKAGKETVRLSSYVSAGAVIRALIDQFIDQVEIEKGGEK